MCLRLSDRMYCLSFLSILGLLQVILSLPIIVLSFLLLVWTTLGVALEPFWCGFVVRASHYKYYYCSSRINNKFQINNSFRCKLVRATKLKIRYCLCKCVIISHENEI